MTTNNTIDVSFVVTTYKPDLMKTLVTIESLIMQKNIESEIIIVDDGSNSDIWDVVIKYIKQRDYYNYSLSISDINEGTVKNYLRGVKLAKGMFVRGISPGDYLIGETTIREWINEIKNSNLKWSFCNVVNYRRNDSGFELLRLNTHPQETKPYFKRDHNMILWNYVIYDDLISGASMIYDRKLLEKYLNEIQGEIIYTEDTMIKLLIMDGYDGYYYDSEALFYEYGSGISTNKNTSYKWSKLIAKDFECINKKCLERASVNINNKELKEALEDKCYYKRNLKNLIKKYIDVNQSRIFIKNIIRWRKTKVDSKYLEHLKRLYNRVSTIQLMSNSAD